MGPPMLPPIWYLSSRGFGAHAGAFRTVQIVQNPPPVHHDNAIAQVNRLLHRVSDHQGGEFVLLDDFVAQADDPSALHYNPAGMTQLHGFQNLFGTSLIGGTTQFTGPTANNH